MRTSAGVQVNGTSRLAGGWNARRAWSVALALAAGLPAVGASASDDEPRFARAGFYLGLGGAYAQPNDWDDDFDAGIEALAAERSMATAAAAAAAIDPRLVAQPIAPPGGADLEDGLPGLDVLIGYRAHPHFAFEAEGEWLFGSNETDVEVVGSTGRHRAEVSDLWTLTANIKAFPFTGRIQPFALFGIGLHHAEIDVNVVTQGLTTIASQQQVGTFVVPADFSVVEKDEELDGAIRAGLGVDVYATDRVVVELKVDYVHPFDDVEFLNPDTFSLRGDLLFRF